MIPHAHAAARPAAAPAASFQTSRHSANRFGTNIWIHSTLRPCSSEIAKAAAIATGVMPRRVPRAVARSVRIAITV